MRIDELVESTYFDHSKQVSVISGILAEKAGFSPAERTVIEQAALLHDIGKSSLPRHILNKPGKLTDEEFAIVKTHTEIGYKQITDAIQMLNIAAVIALEHHERWDGENSYMSMSGGDIHPYARLISCCDVADALLSRRAYKSPWPLEKVKEYFHEQAGRQFEREFAMLLLNCFDEIVCLYRMPA